ncbi:MAG: DNA polymerase/3'-5' exonuclease PolX [Microgenomates bacterium OLB23]|nr:MAG: DNA polymerase/3'-5' exonuclease PolX [Microgenomates bacterium OLB23]
MHITNKQLVHLLRSVAAAYTLTNVNRFRIIAYQKAADAIEGFNQEVYDAWENKGLQGIAEMGGIGPTICQHLDEYFAKQSGSFLEKQLNTIPSPVYELMRAPGIGPKKAYRIVKEFNLSNLVTVFSDVEKLASTHKIAALDGFGEKSEADIAKAIRTHLGRLDKEERMALPEAFALAEEVIMYMKQQSEVEEINALGSLRRRVSTIGDIDVAVVAKESTYEKILAHFVNYPQTSTIENKGTNKAAIITKNGTRIDLRIVNRERYGAMLQYFTGSKGHNIKLREYALKKGFSLNEFGIKNVKTGTTKTFENEEDFYAYLKLPYIVPELREGTDEIKRAIGGKLPQLVELRDIRGEFHVHSSFPIEPSHDLGLHTFEEMIETAQHLNYKYLAFSEHNPSVSKHSAPEVVALLKAKKQALMEVQKQHKNITLLNSLEIDILPNGELAVPIEALAHLDLCVVSIHSAFNQSRDVMTQRILKALSYPKVKILGHPTARLINKREEIDADWDMIFKFVAKHNIALEINAFPNRLDLPDTMVRKALSYSCQFVIDTDAHRREDMQLIFLVCR